MKRFHYEVLVHCNYQGTTLAEDEEQGAEHIRAVYERAYPNATLVDVINMTEEADQ
jgi:hypothetical protein